MLDFAYCRRTAYYFGQDCERDVGLHIKKYGGTRVLLVYGCGSCVRSGLLERVRQSLDEQGIFHIDHGGIRPNPPAVQVYELIDLIRGHAIDFVLAVGGGSVIDSAKAAAVGAFCSGDFFDKYFIKGEPPVKALPVGVVLTVPGSGSESSDKAVVEKEVNGLNLKLTLQSLMIVPCFSVMNPRLTVSLSEYQTGCGIVDMLTHVMERYFSNTTEVAVTDRLCEGLMQSIVELAPRVLRDPQNYDARANLMLAAAYAHNDSCGVGREQDWASHRLEHQLSALLGIAHGAGMAVIIPAWMEYVLPHDPMRFAQFASRVFGVPIDFTDPTRTALHGIRTLRTFFAQLNMPLNFADLGIGQEIIPKLIDMLQATSSSEGRFVRLSAHDCENIYRNAATYKPRRGITVKPEWGEGLQQGQVSA